MLPAQIEHVQTMTNEMPTLDSARNITPYSETNEENAPKNDIRNLGIKTTISITHNRIQQEINEKINGDMTPKINS